MGQTPILKKGKGGHYDKSCKVFNTVSCLWFYENHFFLHSKPNIILHRDLAPSAFLNNHDTFVFYGVQKYQILTAIDI